MPRNRPDPLDYAVPHPRQAPGWLFLLVSTLAAAGMLAIGVAVFMARSTWQPAPAGPGTLPATQQRGPPSRPPSAGQDRR